MTFYKDGLPITRARALHIAAQVSGIDPLDLAGIVRRLASEEDAREVFYDLTELEVVA